MRAACRISRREARARLSEDLNGVTTAAEPFLAGEFLLSRIYLQEMAQLIILLPPAEKSESRLRASPTERIRR
jgi:hypothetical protein